MTKKLEPVTLKNIITPFFAFYNPNYGTISFRCGTILPATPENHPNAVKYTNYKQKYADDGNGVFLEDGSFLVTKAFDVSVSRAANLTLNAKAEGVNGWEMFILDDKTRLTDHPEYRKFPKQERKRYNEHMSIGELCSSNNNSKSRKWTLYAPESILEYRTSYNTVEITAVCATCEHPLVVTAYAFMHAKKNPKCPICDPNSNKSEPECSLYNFFVNHPDFEILQFSAKEGPDRVLYYTDVIVLHIPSGKIIAFEYDGWYWHQDRTNHDAAKTKKVLMRVDYAVRLRATGLLSLKKLIRSKRYTQLVVLETLLKRDPSHYLEPLLEELLG